MVNLTLSFKDEAEAEFLDRFFQRSLTQMRFALILGIVLYAMFGLLDAIAAPAQKTPMWIIRYAIVCPLFAIGWALSYTPYFRRYAQLMLTVLPVIAGFGIIAMTVIAPMPVNYLYPSGLILVLMWEFTFIRLRFVYSAIGSILIVAAYLVTASIVGATPGWIIVNNAFFLLTVVIPLLRSIRTQQRLDCAAFVHCTVSLCYLVERQREIEYFARIDLAVEHELDQIRQVSANRRRTAV